MNLVGHLRNVSTLRVITIITSFMFIPAFIYGFVSIWIIFISIILAFYSRSHLTRIKNDIKIFNQEAHIKGKLVLLSIENFFIIITPQFFLAWLYGHEILKLPEISNIDLEVGLYTHFAPSILTSKVLINTSLKCIVVASYILSVFLCLTLLVLNYISLRKIFDYIFYKKVILLPQNSKQASRYAFENAKYSYLGSVFGLLVPLAWISADGSVGSYLSLSPVVTSYEFVILVCGLWPYLAIASLLLMLVTSARQSGKNIKI